MGPQPGIIREGNSKHWFLEFEIADTAGVGGALAEVESIAHGDTPADTVEFVVSFGAELARALLGEDVPADLRQFAGVEGPSTGALGTKVDLFVWLHSDRHDRNFDVALAARRAFGALGEVVADVPAWLYLDARDLTGFIDGTENPPADEGRELAVITEGPGAGGALVFTQRWVHDLDSFHALEQSEQEAIIGRTRPDSVELDPLPESSHVGRVVIEDDDGEELELYRRSVPYGTVTEAGLFFLAFPNDFGLIEAMLDRMFGNDGPPDRLIEFSEAVSGAYTFAPSTEALASLVSGTSLVERP